MMGLLGVLFCNCCYGGCDCGCVEDCGLTSHRRATLTPPAQSDEGSES